MIEVWDQRSITMPRSKEEGEKIPSRSYRIRQSVGWGPKRGKQGHREKRTGYDWSQKVRCSGLGTRA
jgi:hypothetical protein